MSLKLTIDFVDTDVVIPVATKPEGSDKFVETYYKVSLIADYPTLGIAIQYGEKATLTPTETIKGYKPKGVKQILWRPIIVVNFDRKFHPTVEEHALKDESLGGQDNKVFVYVNGTRQEMIAPNHIAMINNHILQTAGEMILSPLYESARFSSWLLVGLHLLCSTKKQVADDYKMSFRSFTQEELFQITVETHDALTQAKTHISENHAKLVAKIKALPATITK